MSSHPDFPPALFDAADKDGVEAGLGPAAGDEVAAGFLTDESELSDLTVEVEVEGTPQSSSPQLLGGLAAGAADVASAAIGFTGEATLLLFDSNSPKVFGAEGLGAEGEKDRAGATSKEESSPHPEAWEGAKAEVEEGASPQPSPEEDLVAEVDENPSSPPSSPQPSFTGLDTAAKLACAGASPPKPSSSSKLPPQLLTCSFGFLATLEESLGCAGCGG